MCAAMKPSRYQPSLTVSCHTRQNLHLLLSNKNPCNSIISFIGLYYNFLPAKATAINKTIVTAIPTTSIVLIFGRVWFNNKFHNYKFFDDYKLDIIEYCQLFYVT